jgi:hypothetical protein
MPCLATGYESAGLDDDEGSVAEPAAPVVATVAGEARDIGDDRIPAAGSGG